MFGIAAKEAPELINPTYEKVELDSKKATDLDTFYRFYLGEHSDQTCRRLHVVGTSLSVALLATAAARKSTGTLLAVPLAGYGLAWVGHYFFEKNRPATFTYPLKSLYGDFRLWFEVISGKRAF